MRTFRKLATASVVATFILIAIGGLVRATKSGLGCGTDWPHCAGQLVPALESRAELIEFSHRAMASVVVMLLTALTIVAYRKVRDRLLRRASAAALGLVLWQAVLGAIVVKLELQAVSVVLHLATALSLLALLIYVVVRADAIDGAITDNEDSKTARRTRIGAGAVLGLLLVGSYVSGVGAERHAGFPEWPLISGRLIPDLGVEMLALHWVHRALAVVVGVVVAVIAIPIARRRHEIPRAATLAVVAIASFALEILVGAANVWTQSNQGLNSVFITAHLALGAVIWASLVAIAAITSQHEKVLIT